MKNQTHVTHKSKLSHTENDRWLLVFYILKCVHAAPWSTVQMIDGKSPIWGMMQLRERKYVVTYTSPPQSLQVS